MKTLGVIVVVLALGAVTTMLSVKYGSPQSVWFYCEMLRWCNP